MWGGLASALLCGFSYIALNFETVRGVQAQACGVRRTCVRTLCGFSVESVLGFCAYNLVYEWRALDRLIAPGVGVQEPASGVG
jgi:hypothetical protein